MKHKRPIRKQRLVCDDRWPWPVFCGDCDDGKCHDIINDQWVIIPCPTCKGSGTIEV